VSQKRLRKNLNPDEHFDRLFSFMAMKGSSQNQSSNKRKEDPLMNFIEQLFGISPDAGSGLVEACLIAVPLGVLVLRALLKRSTNHHWGV
jgi:hypothetical protein